MPLSVGKGLLAPLLKPVNVLGELRTYVFQ
jgi:hypothetical protein